MNKLRERLRQFMMGRYGMDQLGQFMMWAILAAIILNILIKAHLPSLILDSVELAMLICLYMRIFSKNIGKRFDENQAFLRVRFYVTEYFKKLKFQFSQRKEYHIFKCPKCGQKIRIPRGHGKVSIHCPKCGTDFIKKS